MKEVVILCCIITLCASQYQPNWNSLNSRPNPSWYDDAKFGIFIHWGVYSVPSYSPDDTSYAEWYWYSLHQNQLQGKGPFLDFHNKNYGADFKYQDFAPMFKAHMWDPEDWADLFVRSGAKYIVPTSKHHEGYTLWPSAQSWNWNAVDVGPQRDLLGDLSKAVRERDLHFCLYYSLYEWFHPLYRSDNPHLYVEQIMLPQLFDVVTNYKPEYIFSDGEWEQTSTFWNSTYFLAWLYNTSPVKDSVLVDDRWGSDTRGKDGSVFTAEYSGDLWWDHKWEENSGIDVFSFGYNRNAKADNYSTPEALVTLLVRTVAYGGNLLLDIGPTDDGRIPVIMEERLLQLGAWLNVNGEAIYATKPWTVRSENSSGIIVFYTESKADGSVYATFLGLPDSGNLYLQIPEASDKTTVTMLGLSDPLKISYKTGLPGITVTLPNLKQALNLSLIAWSIKITNLVPLPQIKPIQNYYSAKNTDNAPCETNSCVNTVTSEGYFSVRIEALGLTAPVADQSVAQLTLYYSSVNEDYISVTNASFLDQSYQKISVQGYVFTHQQPGFVPLHVYWSQVRKDYYLVGCLESLQDALSNNYVYVTTIGYTYPGPYYSITGLSHFLG